MNETLTKQEGDGPKVSLSVGVVFSDRKNPGRTILRMRIRRCTNRRTTENGDAASMRACRRKQKPRNTKRKSNKRSPVSKLRPGSFSLYTVPRKRLQAAYFTLSHTRVVKIDSAFKRRSRFRRFCIQRRRPRNRRNCSWRPAFRKSWHKYRQAGPSLRKRCPPSR